MRWTLTRAVFAALVSINVACHPMPYALRCIGGAVMLWLGVFDALPANLADDNVPAPNCLASKYRRSS